MIHFSNMDVADYSEIIKIKYSLNLNHISLTINKFLVQDV